MKHISEMTGGITEVVIYEMPELKIIGYETRTGGVLGDRINNLIERCRKDGLSAKLKQMPRIVNADLGWSGNYTPEDETYSYIIGVFVPIDTPVPEGWDWRPLPATFVAKGIRGEGYLMAEVYDKMGYTQNYDLRGWNADVFFDNEPEDGKWTCISPVRLKKAPDDRFYK